MSMSMIEIERALRELRLSGIRATLETRILQAQANCEPFLETFSLILQDELDRRRSRLLERRYQKSGLDARIMPVHRSGSAKAGSTSSSRVS